MSLPIPVHQPAHPGPAESLLHPMTLEVDRLRVELADVCERLGSALETLRAIRYGEVDALVVETVAEQDRVFTLSSADRPYRNFVENMSEGAATVSADGIVLYANQALADLVGSSCPRIVGQPIHELVTRAGRIRLLDLMTSGTQPGSIEVTLLAVSGRTVPVRIGASMPMRINGADIICLILTDLTNEHRIAGAFEFLTEGVLLASAVRDSTGNPVDLRIEHVNRSFLALRTESRDELLHGLYSTALPGRDGGKLLGQYLAVVRSGSPLTCVLDDYSTEAFTGALEVTATPWEDGVAVTVRDVRARQKSAKSLAATAAALVRSNEDLEQFAYAASHDLGEPLRSIAGFTQLLTEEMATTATPEAIEYSGFITGGVTRMRGLIDGLLEYSRVSSRPVDESERGQAVDSAAVVADALSDLRVAIDDARATVTVTRPMPAVLADATEFRRVIQNLVANAIKFRRPGQPPHITISGRLADADVAAEFSVADDGIGIPPAHRQRVFLMFTRLQRREDYEGTGIGLAVTRKIVERHGGRLWVDETPGGGSTFRFTTPTPSVLDG